MGIWALVEIDKGEFALAEDGHPFVSKPLASFIIGPLWYICSSKEEQKKAPDDEWYRGVRQWFSRVTIKMTQDICLLDQATFGPWPYLEDDYERYCNDYQSFSPAAPIASYERFVQVCRDIEQKWTDADVLKRCVDNLVRVLEEIHPEDNWFYSEEGTLPALRLLSQVLESAHHAGHERVRIYCD